MSLILSVEESEALLNKPLVGRVLMLNTVKAPRFQCYRFFVTRNHPIETVPQFAQEGPIRTALSSGILLDITDSKEDLAKSKVSQVIGEIDSAIKEGQLESPTEGAEISKILMGKDSKGNSYLIIPKDEADYERMQTELATTGTLRVEKPKQAVFTGLSGITIEDIEPEPEL